MEKDNKILLDLEIIKRDDEIHYNWNNFNGTIEEFSQLEENKQLTNEIVVIWKKQKIKVNINNENLNIHSLVVWILILNGIFDKWLSKKECKKIREIVSNYFNILYNKK